MYTLQYPRILLFAGCIIAAYFLFEQEVFDWLIREFDGKTSIGAFVAGILFSFGFTSPFAVAFFIELAPQVDPLPAAVIGGAGAFLADLVIFDLLRSSFFHDEIHRLRATRFFRWLESLLHHEKLSERIRQYLLWSFAGIIIASPLPDEIGVSLVSGITRIEIRKFAVMSFVLNTVGVFVILMLARFAAA